jgi:hypothetical protein
MYRRGEIPEFVEAEPKSDAEFSMSSGWGTGQIYAQYEQQDIANASAVLYLVQQSERAYLIAEKITVDPDDDFEFAKEFLTHLCGEATLAGIFLSIELNPSHIDYEFQCALLYSCGFRITASDENELWEKSP